MIRLSLYEIQILYCLCNELSGHDMVSIFPLISWIKKMEVVTNEKLFNNHGDFPGAPH